MERWHDLAEVPAGWGPSVVAMGTFDGVHRGHQVVLSRVVAAARERGAGAVAVTFTPHPLAVLHPERAPAALTTPGARAALLGRCGLDAVLELPFTHELAAWSPERFVADVLVSALHAVAVVVGQDVRFGAGGAGDLGVLRALGGEHGVEVVLLDDARGVAPADPGAGGRGAQERRWSSTWARQLLLAGDVEAAAAQLGRPHRLVGTVVHGDHRGRELGYPTANLDGVRELVPADGVYAAWLLRDPAGPGAGERMPAALSIGTNPTFDGLERRVEAHVLLDAPGARGSDPTAVLDLYGERVGIDLVARLRPMLRFESVEELLVQMDDDVARARALLAEDRTGQGPPAALVV